VNLNHIRHSESIHSESGGGSCGGSQIIDLGCGDGRWLIRAAQKWGLLCKGYELDPMQLELANSNVASAGLGHLIELVAEDLFQADISSAHLVIMYLSIQGAKQIKSKLERELSDGSAVIAVGFAIRGWVPQWSSPAGSGIPVYLYHFFAGSSVSDVSPEVKAIHVDTSCDYEYESSHNSGGGEEDKETVLGGAVVNK